MANNQQIVDPLFGDAVQERTPYTNKPVVDPLFGPDAEKNRVGYTETLARDLPEISTAPQIDLVKSAFSGGLEDMQVVNGLLANAGFLSTTNQDERAQILLKQFPDAFEILEDPEGNLVAESDQGSFALNKPGISPADISSFVFRTLVNLPAGKSVSTATTVGKQLVSRAAQVAGKSAGTEAALQGVEAGVGGEFNTGEVALAGVTGGIVEGAVGLPQARAALSVPSDVVDESAEVASRTGIRLSRAQQTVDPYLLEEQAFVGQLPPGARAATRFLKTQNDEAADAVQSLLADFGTPQSVVVGPKKIRDLSQKAIELKKAARAESASPLYKQAFRSFRGELDVSDVVKEIDLRAAKYPDRHPAAIALRRYKEDILENAGSLERLQGAKEVADVELANLAQRGTSASNKATRELTQVQNLLLNKMDEASPDFALAREVYARDSAPVDALRESLVGRVADVKDARLKTVARAIFDPAETNPRVVREARRAITSMEGGDEAWGDIVRTELERRLGSVRADIGDSLISGDLPENLPSQLRRALFRNKKDKDVLLAGLNDEQREAVNFLDNALRRASLGRPGGSQTAIREEIRNRFDRGFISALRRFIREPIATTAEMGAESAREARISSVSEVIFNPDWAVEVNRIRRLAGDQEQKFFDLFSQASNALAQSGRAQVENADNKNSGEPR